MNFLGFIRKKKSKMVHVIKYPNEFLIETVNSSNTGTWLRSKFVSLKSATIGIDELGKIISFHLEKSERVDYEKYDLKEANENYKKVSKRKTIKEQMMNAKLVSVRSENNTITLTPHINGGTKGNSRGYEGIEEDELILANTGDMTEITKAVIRLFEKCK